LGDGNGPDLCRAFLAEDPGTSPESGSGRKNIIHKKDDLPFDGFLPDNGERITNIVRPVIALQRSLRRRIPGFSEDISGNGDPRSFSDFSGDSLGLIESTFPLAPFMKRNRDDQVDILPENLILFQGLERYPSQNSPERTEFFIFQEQDGILKMTTIATR